MATNPDKGPREASALGDSVHAVGIFTIGRRLGVYHRHARWVVRYLQTLQRDAGFPAPFPFMRGNTLTQEIQLNSRWPREAVDAWFTDRLPPDTAAAVDEAAARQAGAEMDQRAGEIFGGPLRLVRGGRP